MSEPVPPVLTRVDGIDSAVDTVAHLHAEHADLLQRIVDAEDEYLRRVAAGHHADAVDWHGLIAAYEQVRTWSKTNGIGRFTDRWEKHFPYTYNRLTQLAQAMPNDPGGKSWSGNTGWAGLDGAVCPQRGTPVAFVLFGNAGVPVHIGYTEQFYSLVRRLSRNGLHWESWFAQLCDNRRHAIEARRELVARYGEPNVAAQANPAHQPT